MNNLITSYRGISNIKPVGIPHSFTEHEIKEYIKCRDDICYFISNYCKIISLDHGLVNFSLYDYQKRMLDVMHNNRMSIFMVPRQMGKTITVAGYILHYTLFNDNKSVALLANKAAGAREILSRYKLAYEELPNFLQHGVKEWNKGSVVLENNSTVYTGATTTSGLRGRSIGLLYIDETADIPNTIADEFFTATYPTISSGKTTKIILTSTPIGLNHFWKFWTDAEHGNNDFVPCRAYYNEHPDRDEEWAEEQRRLLGNLKFNQEIACEFLGSSGTLLSADALRKLVVHKPISEYNNISIYEDVVQDGAYVAICDPSSGLSLDYSAISIIRIDQLPYKQVAVFRDNKISPLHLPNILHKLGTLYNKAMVLIEINKSEQISYILFNELEYDNMIFVTRHPKKGQLATGGASSSRQNRFGVMTDKKVKRIGCTMLKELIETGKLSIMDANTISEFSTFIEKKSSFAADDGKNDDIVMTLVLFGWLTSQEYFAEIADINIRAEMFNLREQQMQDEMLPLGHLVTGLEEEIIEAGWTTTIN